MPERDDAGEPGRGSRTAPERATEHKPVAQGSGPRRWLRLAMAPAIVALGLALAILALIPIGGTWLADIAEEQARKRGIELSLETLHVVPLAAELRFEGLELAEGPAPVQAATVRSGSIVLSRRHLLLGELRPSAIRLVGPEVVLVRESEGESSPSGDAGVDPAPLSRLRTVVVERARIVYLDEVVEFSGRVEGLHLGGVASGYGSEGYLSSGALHVEIEGVPPLEAASLRARWEWRGGRLRASGLSLEGPHFAAEGRGALALARQGIHIDAEAWGQVSLPWVSEAWELPAMRGRAGFEAVFEMRRSSRWDLRARLEERGSLDVAGVGIERARAQVRLTPEGLFVTRGEVESAGGSRLEEVELGWRSGSFSAASRGELLVEELVALAGLPPEIGAGRAALELEAASQEGEPITWSLEGQALPGGEEGAAGLEGRFEARGAAGRGGALFEGRWGGAPLVASGGWTEGEGGGSSWSGKLSLRAAAPRRVSTLLEHARLVAEGRDLPLPSGLDGLEASELDLVLQIEGIGGRLEELEAEGSLLALRVGGLDPVHLELSARRSEGGAWAGEARLGDARSGAGVLARLDEAQTPALQLVAQQAPLEWVGLAAGLAGVELPCDPRGSLDGEASVVLEQAPSAAFSVSGRGSCLGVPEARFAALGAWDGAELSLSRATLDLPFARASVSGRFAPAAWGDAAPGEGLQLDGKAWVDLDRAIGVVDTPARGRVSWSGELILDGEDAPLRAEGQIELERFGTRDVRIPSAKFAVAFADETLELRGGTPGVAIEASVEGALSEPRFDAAMSWDDLELTSMLLDWGILDELPALALRTGGTMTLAGAALDPATWRGAADMGQLSLDAGFAGLDLVEPVHLEISEGRALIDPATPLRLDAYTGDHVEVRGGIELWSDSPGSIDLELAGAVDLRLVEAFDPDVIAGGQVDFDLRVAGFLTEPSFLGSVSLQEGRARLLPMRESISALEASLALEGTRASVETGSFSLGGGRTRFSGFFEMDGWMPGALDLTLVARDVALSAPEGFWGRYDADLLVRGTLVRPELAGKVRIRTARYDEDFELTPRLFARSRSLAPQASRASWLAGVALDLRLEAPPVVSIRNEQVRAEMSMNLAVGGTATRPLIAGSAEFVEGGRFEFRGVTYQIIAGQLTLDELRGQPARLRMRSRTDLQGYAIKLEIDATTEGVEYTLTSTPALTEGDILALLLTGETLSSGSGNLNVDPAELAAAYFGSSIGELLLADTARLLGFSEFRIGTARVGPQAEPVARVTVGRRLDDRTLALYSRDLSSEGRDVYSIERELGRDFRAGVGRGALGGVGGAFRWFHRFGDSREGRVEPGEGEGELRFGELRLVGVPEDVRVRRIRDLGVRRRDELNRSRVLQAKEGLLAALISEGYLEARVADARVEPEGGDQRGTLVLEVEAGERWKVRYEGARGFERRLRESLSEIWAGTRFSLETLSDAERILADDLAQEGHAAGLVDLSRPDPERRELLLTVDPGPRVIVGSLEIEGASALDEEAVRQQVLSRPGGGLSRSVYRPRTLAADVTAIRTLYESEGYLASNVETRVRYQDEGSRVGLTLIIEEGPRYRFGEITIEGEWPEGLPPAASLLTVSEGKRFDPDAIVVSETRLRRELDAQGYYAARVLARAELGADETVKVAFRLEPGDRAIIGDIDVEGLEHTERRLVERAIDAEEDEPLTSAQVRNTERDLFRLGLFRRVQVDLEPIEGDPVRKRLVLRLEETPRWSMLLSAGYDTEEKLRGSAALSNENLFGRGRVGSLQVFASSLNRGARFTLEDRHARGGTLEALATIGSTREEKVGYTLDQVRGALQIGSSSASRRRWVLRYQVDFNRVREVTLDEESLQDELDNEGIPSDTELLAGLVASVFLDERDDPFLPESGWLARSELGFWDEGLGSEANFATWTGQISIYRPLVSKLSFAGSLRLGAGWTFRNTSSVPISERFFAGGAQSLRGFERDQAGPFDPVSGAFLGGGGEALFLANLELRYRIRPSFDLVLFQDTGNTWARLDDMDMADLRETLGLGIRWRSPVGILRLEYARKLDQREGESGGEVFLSIGEPW